MPASTPAGRIRAALRSLHPANVGTLALALVLGAGGGAAAATGGNFILGKANTETTTASLSNAKGTPLMLSAPFGVPQLRVNKTDAVIPNLDAQFAGGYTGNQMANFGGDGFVQPVANTPVDSVGELVAETDPLPAGAYYVTATALVEVAPSDGGLICRLTKGSQPLGAIGYGGGGFGLSRPDGNIQAAETAAVSVTTDDTLQEWCQTGSSNGSILANAGITAIRIAFPLGTKPARAGTPVNRTLPALTSPAR